MSPSAVLDDLVAVPGSFRASLVARSSGTAAGGGFQTAEVTLSSPPPTPTDGVRPAHVSGGGEDTFEQTGVSANLLVTAGSKPSPVDARPASALRDEVEGGGLLDPTRDTVAGSHRRRVETSAP